MKERVCPSAEAAKTLIIKKFVKNISEKPLEVSAYLEHLTTYNPNVNTTELFVSVNVLIEDDKNV